MQAMSDNLYANKHVACRTRNVAVCVEKNCAETRRAEANCAETGPALMVDWTADLTGTGDRPEYTVESY